MAVLHIIAGPPGIGKSTEGRFFVPKNVEILNHDILRLYYKNQNEPDYENLSDIKANEFIQTKLKSGSTFGVEINLGYENHYELLKYVRNLYPSYHIQVCLFFTDDVSLCIDRALLRFQAGGHLVSQDTIQQMYNNTLTLLKTNAWLIHSLLLINVDDTGGELCFQLNPASNQLSIAKVLPDWVNKQLPGILKLRQLVHEIL